MKKFKKSDWQAMKIVSQPTATAPMIRADADGKRWAWKNGGKYVHAEAVKPDAVTGTKGVGYAYASSPLATSQGMAKTGCYYVYTCKEDGKPEAIVGVSLSFTSCVESAAKLPGGWDRWSKYPERDVSTVGK